MSSFWLRALCSIAADGSLAMLCGLLLTRVWLHREPDLIRLPSPLLPSVTLAVAVALQLLAMTASFTEASSMPTLFAALPDIVATHPGKVLLLTLLAALCLTLCAAISERGTRYQAALAGLLAACLFLRSGTGHAATENIFSVPQALQFLHLTGMAIWSGGVLLSGLIVLPRLALLRNPATIFRNALASLSLTSTWAVGITIFAGIGKTWIAARGNFPAAWHSGWTIVLIAKICLVCIALMLGLINRRWLDTLEHWASEERSRAVLVLRLEAIAMLAILALSGVLANMPPPGE